MKNITFSLEQLIQKQKDNGIKTPFCYTKEYFELIQINDTENNLNNILANTLVPAEIKIELVKLFFNPVENPAFRCLWAEWTCKIIEKQLFNFEKLYPKNTVPRVTISEIRRYSATAENFEQLPVLSELAASLFYQLDKMRDLLWAVACAAKTFIVNLQMVPYQARLCFRFCVNSYADSRFLYDVSEQIGLTEYKNTLVKPLKQMIDGCNYYAD